VSKQVVMFVSDGCQPCAAMKPLMIEACDSVGIPLTLTHVTAASPELEMYGIRGVPSVIAFQDGQIINRFTGARTKAQLEEFIRSL